MKKTKIVATIGPASEGKKILTKMIHAGMNIARLNFSHGTHQEHLDRIKQLRAVAKETGENIAILQDLCGPKIRTGEMESESIQVPKGCVYTFTNKEVVGNSRRCTISYPHLSTEVEPGHRLFVNDGKLTFEVMETKPQKGEVLCKTIVGGIIKSRKGVNVPNSDLKNLKTLTKKDISDLAFGLESGVDAVALSFVRSKDDVIELKKRLADASADVRVIAKIETSQAVTNIEEIIEVVDAIMVARGDLAIEIPPEDVPLIQKRITLLCRQVGKPCIVATQMLGSMVENSRPSRAEVSDVANAILDGADAIMLSEETAVGSYPVEAIEIMSSVAQKVEPTFSYKREKRSVERKQVVDSVSFNVVKTAEEVGAKAIIALSETGLTPRLIARFRPQQDIHCLTPYVSTFRSLAFSYGCNATKITKVTGLTSARKRIHDFIIENKIAKHGDLVIIAAGIPFGHEGGTNMMLVERVEKKTEKE